MNMLMRLFNAKFALDQMLEQGRGDSPEAVGMRKTVDMIWSRLTAREKSIVGSEPMRIEVDKIVKGDVVFDKGRFIGIANGPPVKLHDGQAVWELAVSEGVWGNVWFDAGDMADVIRVD